MSLKPLSPNTIRCFSDDYCINLKHYKINVPQDFGTTFNLEVNQYGRERLKYGNILWDFYPDTITENGPDNYIATEEVANIKYQDLRPINSIGRKFGCLNYIVKMNCIQDCKPGGTQANALGYLGPKQVPFYICNTGHFIYEYRNKEDWIPDGDNTLYLRAVYYLEDLTTLKDLSDFDSIYDDTVIYSNDSFNLTEWNNPSEIGFERITFEEAEEIAIEEGFDYYEMPEELTASACKKFKKIRGIVMNWGKFVVDESLGIINEDCLDSEAQNNVGSKKISEEVKQAVQRWYDDLDVDIDITIVCPHTNVSQGRRLISNFIDEPRNYYRMPNHLEETLTPIGPEDISFNLNVDLFYPAGYTDPNSNLQYYVKLWDRWSANEYELARGPMSINEFDNLPLCSSKEIKPTYNLYSLAPLYNSFQNSISLDDFIESLEMEDATVESRMDEIEQVYSDYLELLGTKTGEDIYVRKVYSPEDIAELVIETTDEDTDLCIIFNDDITPIRYDGYLKDYNPPVYNYSESYLVQAGTFLEKRHETNWLNSFIDSIGTQREFEVIIADNPESPGPGYKGANHQGLDLCKMSINPDVDYDIEAFPTIDYTPYIVEHSFDVIYDPVYDFGSWYRFGKKTSYRAIKETIIALQGVPDKAYLQIRRSNLDSTWYFTKYLIRNHEPEDQSYISGPECISTHNAFGAPLITPPGWPTGYNGVVLTCFGQNPDDLCPPPLTTWGSGDVFTYPRVQCRGHIIVKPLTCGTSSRMRVWYGNEAKWIGCGYSEFGATFENWRASYLESMSVIPNDGPVYYSNQNGFYANSAVPNNSIINKPVFGGEIPDVFATLAIGEHPFIIPQNETNTCEYWYLNTFDTLYKYIHNPYLSSIKVEPIFYNESDEQIYSTRCNDRPISSMYIIEPDDSFDYRSIYDVQFVNEGGYIAVFDDIYYYYDTDFYYHNSNPGDYFREFETRLDSDGKLDKIIARNYYGFKLEYRPLNMPEYSTSSFIDGLDSNADEFDEDSEGVLTSGESGVFTLTLESLLNYRLADICNVPRQIRVTVE